MSRHGCLYRYRNDRDQSGCGSRNCFIALSQLVVTTPIFYRLQNEPYSEESFVLLCLHLIGHLPVVDNMPTVEGLVKQAQQVIQSYKGTQIQLLPERGSMSVIKGEMLNIYRSMATIDYLSNL